jgi:hypothetical protein
LSFLCHQIGSGTVQAVISGDFMGRNQWFLPISIKNCLL